MIRKFVVFLSIVFFIGMGTMGAQDSSSLIKDSGDSLAGKTYQLPNIEVGKGITFQPPNKSYQMTMRFRMQNMVGVAFDDCFAFDNAQAQVKRLRLRLDGYMYSPKIVYSIQMGFTPYDSKTLPNGNGNIIRDAILSYVPNTTWRMAFGQTKIRANRAQVNSSSALQFVDRSIVNSQFSLDRDFGFFGEYHKHLFSSFNFSVKGSVTTGEGRNWVNLHNWGLAYTGRLELFPMGRFKGQGELFEGDMEREESPKLLLAGAYCYNQKAIRFEGQKGDIMPEGQNRNLQTYFVDLIFKYQGFALYTDYMSRFCHKPSFTGSEDEFVYTGNGLNVQASYLFPKYWEIALRNSVLLPKKEVKSRVGYDSFNQTTLGVTRYLIGHTLKIQADASYNHRSSVTHPVKNGWEFRFQLELGF